MQSWYHALECLLCQQRRGHHRDHQRGIYFRIKVDIVGLIPFRPLFIVTGWRQEGGIYSTALWVTWQQLVCHSLHNSSSQGSLPVSIPILCAVCQACVTLNFFSKNKLLILPFLSVVISWRDMILLSQPKSHQRESLWTSCPSKLCHFSSSCEKCEVVPSKIKHQYILAQREEVKGCKMCPVLLSWKFARLQWRIFGELFIDALCDYFPLNTNSCRTFVKVFIDLFFKKLYKSSSSRSSKKAS